ncbi:MAG: ribonuclease HI [Chloroflexota bacterium]
MTSPTIMIYTDGSCSPNPGPGGWAAILCSGPHEKVLSGGERKTTNNRMELTAALQALLTLKTPSKVEIVTDSEYLRRGITEWLPGWKKRNWQRKSGTLANIDLWQALDAILPKHIITWKWVRGHAGHKYNTRVDELARQAIPR